MARIKRAKKTILIRPEHFQEIKRIARKDLRPVYGVIELALEAYFETRKQIEMSFGNDTEIGKTGIN